MVETNIVFSNPNVSEGCMITFQYKSPEIELADHYIYFTKESVLFSFFSNRIG